MAKTASEIRKEINDLKSEMYDAEKNEQVANAAKDSAVAVKAMYDAFVEQGFNEAQAYELTVVMLKKQ